MTSRIQRQRTKGWRMPPGAIYVGRGTRWGNPFRVGSALAIAGYDGRDRYAISSVGTSTAEQVVSAYRSWLTSELRYEPDLLEPLRGRDLACWCPLDAPCHADVLLELLA